MIAKLHFALVSTLLLAGGDAFAQAWVAPENSLDVGAGYFFNDSNGHYGGGLKGPDVLQGEDLDHVRSHSYRVGAEYSTPVKGLSVGVDVYAINPDFVGSAMYNPHGDFQHCATVNGMMQCNHEASGTKLTDFLADARYQTAWAPGGLAITPTVGVTLPMRDYPTIGHVGYGKNLKEARVGLDIGRFIGEKAYVDFLYTYSIVEHLDVTPDADAMGLNRSDARLIGGYFVHPKISLFAGGQWRHVHGGFSWGDTQAIRAKVMAGEMLTPLEKTKAVYHDQLARERAWIVAGGVSAQPMEKLSLQLSFVKLLDGDSVPNLFGVSLSAAWTVF